MKSNDEDLELFLDEFITLLNKYHYTLKSFGVARIDPPDYYVAGFESNGDGILHTLYVTKEIYLEDKDKTL